MLKIVTKLKFIDYIVEKSEIIDKISNDIRDEHIVHFIFVNL